MEDLSSFAVPGIAMMLGLAACVATDEPALPTNHPANPSAAEAPRQPLRYALGSDADSARTRRLLTNPGHRDQPQMQNPTQSSEMGQPDMPATIPDHDQP